MMLKGQIGNLVKQEEEIKKFYKAAFLIDGEVELITMLNGYSDFKINAVIKLTDSKRGIFYIANVIKR